MSHMLEHGFSLFKQGAEAKLYVGTYLGKPTIIKERFFKSYRHPQLDSTLSKERTKSEAKSILRCTLSGIRTPAIYVVDHPNGRIYMEHVVNSITVKDYIIGINDKIEKNPNDANNKKILLKLMAKIGDVLSQMHQKNIIHGDLTTSNILIAPPVYVRVNANDSYNFDDGEIVLLDFGLSHIDNSDEDKGVDLYVLERALISTHSSLTYLFESILDVYKRNNINHSTEILIKLREIRARGRKRTMIG